MISKDDIRELTRTLGVRTAELLALVPWNDPFNCEMNGRKKEAEWFAEICAKLRLGHGLHTRRVHYMMISQSEPILKRDGTPYQNTEKDWAILAKASRDARYLGLVNPEWFVDRRNPDPIINAKFMEYQFAPSIGVENAGGFSGSAYWLPDEPDLPSLSLNGFIAEQRYLVEIWVEKTTQHDTLEPLARRYGVNLISFSGEGSETACRGAIQRAQRARRPLRILYISDFDPGGRSMPVAIARKIEYWLARRDSDLDVGLDPIALLPEQVEQYSLPRTPIKETENRAAKFENDFGKGAVELDALEALHPGELHRIVEQAILQYIDPDLKDRQEADADAIEEDLCEIEDRVYEAFDVEISEVKARYNEILESLKELQKNSAGLWEKIAASLEDNAMNVCASEIPEAPEADEEAPLFNSKRDYLTQLDWYRHWQRRPDLGAAP